MGLFTKAELQKKALADLKELANEHDIEAEDDWKVADYRAALLEVPEPDDDEEDDDEVDDSADEVDEDEEDDIEDPELPEADEVDEAPEPEKKTRAKKTKYTEGGKADNGEKLLGAKEVAAALGTEAKTLRQFFRSDKSTITPAGAGGRYEFKESDIEAIKAEFEGWKANKPGRGRQAGSTSSGSKRTRGSKPPAAVDTLDEVEEIEDLDDLDDEIDDEDLELDD